jgi:hypothetical protein
VCACVCVCMCVCVCVCVCEGGAMGLKFATRNMLVVIVVRGVIASIQ